MQLYFYELADRLNTCLQSNELLMCNFYGENSHFVRLNKNRIRQAGYVVQQSISLHLVNGNKHSALSTDLTGTSAHDFSALQLQLSELRERLNHLPDDPYLNYATEIDNSESISKNSLPDPRETLSQIIDMGGDLDVVGIWASGEIFTGFSNSIGQKNWHSSRTFNFDWSCYHNTDKAVKQNYAGTQWDDRIMDSKFQSCRQQLEIVSRAPKTISPGRYRAYLAPAAMQDLVDMMSWGGFGLKSHKTAQTPLIKMTKENHNLDESITLSENSDRGLAPTFTSDGFCKPNNVKLITVGKYADYLVNSRSAKEFGANPNCDFEMPQSIEMNTGSIEESKLLTELDTGLYINNLWYCNFSDRNNCKITGMTRFATFWVEKGIIQSPLNVMRFDDSVYNILGTNLHGLTQTSQLILNPGTYDRRSMNSYKLPGAIIKEVNFTL